MYNGLLLHFYFIPVGGSIWIKVCYKDYFEPFIFLVVYSQMLVIF